MALSFAQTSPRENIQKWMLQEEEILPKNMFNCLQKCLWITIYNHLYRQKVGSTDSITPPFSDKLTMFFMASLSVLGLGNFATSAATSQRSDLAVNYERLSLEVVQYAKDGADIMIQNGWFEQPPGTLDKEKLINKKELNN